MVNIINWYANDLANKNYMHWWFVDKETSSKDMWAVGSQPESVKVASQLLMAR